MNNIFTLAALRGVWSDSYLWKKKYSLKLWYQIYEMLKNPETWHEYT